MSEFAAIQAEIAAELERRKERAQRITNTLTAIKAALSPKQRAYVESKAPRRSLTGSRQSGKSHDIGVDMLETGFNTQGDVSMYVAPTSKAARSAVWSKLHELNNRFDLGIELKEASFRAIFPTKHEIHFEGAHDTARVRRLRGVARLKKLWVDEVAFFPEPIITELVGPTAAAMFLASPGGQNMTLASSPGMQRRGFMFDIVHNRRDTWEPHALYVYDNPTIKDPEAALAEMRAASAWSITSPAYLREGLGQWVDDASYNVYELGPHNIIDAIPTDKPFTSIMTIDFGLNDQSAICVAGWRDHDPTLYVQYVEGWSDIDIEDLAQKAIPLIERYKPVGIYADSAGAQHIKYLNARHSMGVMPVSKKPNYKAPAIAELNADMRRGFYAVPRGSPLIEQMQALQWDPIKYAAGKREEHPLMPNDLCDVAGVYAFVQAKHFRAEPAKPLPPMHGTPEYWAQKQAAELRAEIADAQKHFDAIEARQDDMAALLGVDRE